MVLLSIPQELPIRYASEGELRALFNHVENILARVRDGELSEVLIEDAAAPEGAGQVRDARTRRYTYFQGGVPVARAHIYENPDDSVGGRGRADPKMVVSDGVMYVTPKDAPLSRASRRRHRGRS